jgi:4'-phosphopantetheinyl transferase
MDVYWLEQTDADVPTENQWLSAGEALFLGRLRFAKRRKDWRLGRWTAKNALAACLNLPCDPLALANIEIRAAASGAPEAFLFNQAAPATISLSHRAGIAMCEVTLPGTGIGCNLEVIEPRSQTGCPNSTSLSVQNTDIVTRTYLTGRGEEVSPPETT